MNKQREVVVDLKIPQVKKLANVYQNAMAAGHRATADSAIKAIYSIGAAEAAIAESTVLAAFLDEV